MQRDSIAALEAAQLADGFVVVYSITDRESYKYAKHVLEQLASIHGLAVTLLANKLDLEHLRTVSTQSKDTARGSITSSGSNSFNFFKF